MDSKIALRDFLVSRRTRLSPADVGLPVHGPRRVSGLRREEVAALAAVSVDHYIRLERGNASLVSDAVIDAVADALRLTVGERRYLLSLARPAGAQRDAQRDTARSTGGGEGGVRQSVQWFLDSLRDTPAYLIGRNGAFLAWNALAAKVFTDFSVIPPHRRFIGWLIFGEPGARLLYVDWEHKARETVAYLRMEWGKRPHDAELGRQIHELSEASDDFRRLWSAQFVLDTTHATCGLDSPAAGRTLELSWETFQMTDDPDEFVVVYTAEKDSPSAVALRRLADAGEGASRPVAHGGLVPD